MMNRRLFTLLVAFVGCFVVLAGGVSAAPLPQGQARVVSGMLGIMWSDAMNGDHFPPTYWLYQNGEAPLELQPGATDPGLLLDLNGVSVTVAVNDLQPKSAADPGTTVIQSIQGASQRTADINNPVALGTSRWLILGCKYADIAYTYNPMSYFGSIFVGGHPSLDDYWREASYGRMNLTGSQTVGWVTMPRPRSAYFTAGGNFIWQDVVNDCTAAVDSQVDFTQFDGLSFLVNDPNYVGPALGAVIQWNLEGVDRRYAANWMPVWGQKDMSVFQHEMGHGYRLPHSASASGETYGDVWDVMGDDRFNCAYADSPGVDPVVGCLGQHLIAYHRDRLGWFAPEQVLVAGPGSHQFDLVDTNADPNITGYRMVRIPINGSTTHYFTVEVRRRMGFDAKLPADAVIIHDIDERLDPAWIVDPSESGVDDGINSSAQWLPGEAFTSLEGNIVVRVDRQTDDGFSLTIVNQAERLTRLIPATVDTYSDGDKPAVNYGTSEELVVNRKGYGAAYLRFDPRAIDGVPVALKLHTELVETAPSERLGRAYIAPNTFKNSTEQWTETTLTYNNAPKLTYSLADAAVSGPGLVEWDLSPSLNLYPDTDSLFTLAIVRSDNATADTKYGSRESPHRPWLSVDYLAAPPAMVEPSPSQTLLPTNDTYAREAKPTNIFGSKTVLNVMNAATDQNGYVKFNLNNLPATLTKATLRLYGTNAGPDGGGVYAVGSSYLGTNTQWLETGLKWTNAPAIGGSAVAQIGKVTVGKWVEVDVTGPALAAMANDNGRLSLGIHNNSNDLVAYSSKEGAHPPELVLDFGDGGPPPPPPPEPETVTYTPTNDAYVMQAKVNNIFGSKTTLSVQNAAKDMNTYVKFNVNTLDGTLDSAVLRLYVTDPGPDGGDVYAVSPTYLGTNTQWLETGLKWSNAPTIGGSPIATIGKAVKSKWVEVDVTSAVANGLANDNGRVKSGPTQQFHQPGRLQQQGRCAPAGAGDYDEVIGVNGSRNSQ